MKLVGRIIALPFLALIKTYQLTLGRLLPDRCRFYPSCSTYAVDSIKLNGPLVGGAQAAWRLLRCGPWSAGGIEEARKWPDKYGSRGNAAYPKSAKQGR